ncbi:MAG: hypothetical protein VKJ06_03740 [Vampirovibrionales bacterium]|nr:hypothetical protein [Vampirovibrionales bacterium]
MQTGLTPVPYVPYSANSIASPWAALPNINAAPVPPSGTQAPWQAQNTPAEPQKTETFKSDSINTGISLTDPITQTERGIKTKISEYVVHLNPLQKLALSAKNTFIETPKSVVKGLSGSPEFDFGDKMRVAQIPYYLGGLALVGSYLAPGGKNALKNALKPALACVGYIVGFPLANATVNTLYKLRYGVDLDMRYHTSKNTIAGVYDSAVFVREDLLPPDDFARMRRKMGIPEGLAAPDWEVKRQLDGLIPAAKVSKLLLGNVLAAVGAGYLAQLPHWQQMPAIIQGVKLALATPGLSPSQKLRDVVTVLKRAAVPVVSQLKAPRWPGVLAAGSVAGALGYTLLGMHRATTRKQYQTPGNVASTFKPLMPNTPAASPFGLLPGVTSNLPAISASLWRSQSAPPEALMTQGGY